VNAFVFLEHTTHSTLAQKSAHQLNYGTPGHLVMYTEKMNMLRYECVVHQNIHHCCYGTYTLCKMKMQYFSMIGLIFMWFSLFTSLSHSPCYTHYLFVDIKRTQFYFLYFLLTLLYIRLCMPIIWSDGKNNSWYDSWCFSSLQLAPLISFCLCVKNIFKWITSIGFFLTKSP